MSKRNYLILVASMLLGFFALQSCNSNPENEINNQENSHFNDSNTSTIPPLDKSQGSLNGTFAIGDNKYVRFSMGNLQYTQSTQVWSFAEQQYEALRLKNMSNPTRKNYGEEYDEYKGKLADKIDLFAWSGLGAYCKWGIEIYYSDHVLSILEDSKYYNGSFLDWGNNPISNGGNKSNLWRTLKEEEWNYLLKQRHNANYLIGVAAINNVGGLIILPDNWILPDGLSFNNGFSTKDNMSAYADHQSYSLSEWTKMEKAGAVFLPITTYRGNSSNSEMYTYDYPIGFYHSSTAYDSQRHCTIRFFSDGLSNIYDYNATGAAVRLVQDL